MLIEKWGDSMMVRHHHVLVENSVEQHSPRCSGCDYGSEPQVTVPHIRDFASRAHRLGGWEYFGGGDPVQGFGVCELWLGDIRFDIDVEFAGGVVREEQGGGQGF